MYQNCLVNGPHDKKLFLFLFYLSHAVKLVLVQIAVTKAEDTMQGINRYCIILLCVGQHGSSLAAPVAGGITVLIAVLVAVIIIVFILLRYCMHSRQYLK